MNIIKSKFRTELKKLVELHSNNKGNFNAQLSILENNGLKIDFMTIHKLLDFRTEFDVDGNRIFVKKSGSTIKFYDLVIIDECSMIPLKMIFDIFRDIDKLKVNKEKSPPKVLFVGDPAQLPPVNERVSAIFNTMDEHFNIDYLKQVLEEENSTNNEKEIHILFDKFKKSVMNQKNITLKHIVRSKQSHIIDLCNNVRKWVIQSIIMPKINKFSGPGVFLYKYYRKGKKDTKWIKKFIDNIKDTNDSNIILTWTNRQSNEYNNYVRKAMFPDKTLDKYERGDILILNDFYNLDESTICDKTDKKKRFYTSEQIKVDDLEQIVKGFPCFNEGLRGIKKMKNLKTITDKYKSYANMMNRNSLRKYRIWKLYTHRMIDISVKDSIPEVYEINVIKDESKAQLNKDMEYCADKIKKLRNHYLINYNDQIESIYRQIIKPLWQEFSKIFKDPFANINYGNSISVHKSQGSTFYNVFVDIEDIVKNRNINETKRCIYTALTRASNAIYLLI